MLLYLDDGVVIVPPERAADVLPLAERAFGQGLGLTPGSGLRLVPRKTEAWSPSGERPEGVPAYVRWRTEGFVVVGAACPGAAELDGAVAGLPVDPRTGPAAQWQAAAEAALRLGDRAMSLRRRR